MNEIAVIPQDVLLSTFEKYQNAQKNMRLANAKYRQTDKGKATKNRIQREWLHNKITNDDYRNERNKKQREYYMSEGQQKKRDIIKQNKIDEKKEKKTKMQNTITSSSEENTSIDI